ncbi:OmpA family protein [Sphingomonas sp.]|uniref:OmpA family protein n=1 Tax=Sphingomonas sp. TaxID=28214 RepID=UPI00286E5147|nr:OmpA family protein [Sphingomonas sp.]
MIRLITAALLLAAAAPALTQPGVPPPPLVDQAALQPVFVAQSGSDRVYFSGDGHGLDQAARTTLAAQARWLRMNPQVRASIEGHADPRRTRDYALGVGERRASAVRDYLISLGVPPGQLGVVSWGKERPAVAGASEGAWALNRRVVTLLIR